MQNRLQEFFPDVSDPQCCAVVVMAQTVVSDGGSLPYYEPAIHIAESRADCRRLVADALAGGYLLRVVTDLTLWDARKLSERIDMDLGDQHIYTAQSGIARNLRSLPVFSQKT
ncbi:hypothetical protein K8942_00795 [Candidatus Peribacteria bacterium]|nr:MAG: hypothetical protein K8942_00795 [Candidatus Peribacteria bacterium]